MKVVSAIFICILCVMMFACRKEAGPGGKNTVSGTVLFKNGASGANDAAPMATVSISYGTHESSAEANQTIVTNSDGTFKFEGLQRGDYFVKAGYTDVHGFKYSHPGYAVTFENRKKTLDITIIVE